jgi:uncharacterized LabA/DUF88 family protein
VPDRLAALIDGPNLYHSVQSLDFDADIGRPFFNLLGSKGTLLRAFYYTEDVPSALPLLNWLDYHGVVVRTKPNKGLISVKSCGDQSTLGRWIQLSTLLRVPHRST